MRHFPFPSRGQCYALSTFESKTSLGPLMMIQMWEYSSINTYSQLQKYYPWSLAKPLKKTCERLILFFSSSLHCLCAVEFQSCLNMTAIYV